MRRLWRYLLAGSDELVMPATWLEDKERLAEYERWTANQLQGAIIIADTQATKNKAFWDAIDAKRSKSVRFPMAV